MRLLFLTNIFPNPYQSNLGIFNLQLAQALAREHELRVISPIAWVNEWRFQRQGCEALGRQRRRVLEGIQVHYPRYYYPPGILRTQFGRFLWRSIRPTVDRLLASYQPEAILSYWVHPDGEAAVRLARLLSVPALVMAGGTDVLLLGRRGARREKLRAVLQAADAIVPVSHDIKEKILDFDVAPEKVHVVARGIDAERFAPGDRQEARQRLGLATEGKIVVWVGRMVPVKGLNVLLEACAKLCAQGVAFRLCLVGDGPLRENLESTSNSFGLAETVSFVGAVPHRDLGDWYRAADWTVLPSLSEGVPNVLRESLACGTPFVASRVGGVGELVDTNVCRLVEPGDASALAEALAGALEEKNPQGPFGKGSATWAESAKALTAILEPLVRASQDADQPWWVGRQPTANMAPPSAPAWRPRQLLRRGLAAVVPRRWLLVRGPVESGKVCLTFDDGPHPVHTPRLLDVLREHGVRATFFVVGRLLRQHPALIRRVADEGHALGIHSFYHANLSLKTTKETLDGALRTQALVTEFTGVVPRLYRPPRGRIGAAKLVALWRAGQSVVLWNRDPRDYACTSAEELRGRFRQYPLQGGDVVLLHDRLAHAAIVLPELIEETRRRGLEFTTPLAWISG